MSRFRKSLFTLFVRTAVLVVFVGVAWAHAILVASSPAANSTVNGPKIDVVLKFNVRIDATRSVVRLVSDDGSGRSLALLPGSSSNVIQTSASDVRPGKYKLSWQVLASDGHITRGEVPFSAR